MVRMRFVPSMDHYGFYHSAKKDFIYNMTIDDASTIINDILKVCKNGCTKEEIIKETRLSHEQIRRITAEIVDKGLLRYIEHQGVYITTDKGYIFLDSKARNQGS